MFRPLREMRPTEAYHLLIQCLVPRPIAWVLSDSGAGRWNLAPFSFFTGVTSAPPLLMLSVGHKPDGSKKDTWRNVEERGHFVVHLPSVEHVEALNATAAVFEHGVSEVEQAGLSTTAFGDFPLPRLVGPRVALGCRLHRLVELGEGPQGVIFGEVECAWLDDGTAKELDGHIVVDPRALDPLARLGGNDYGEIGRTFTVRRPR